MLILIPVASAVLQVGDVRQLVLAWWLFVHPALAGELQEWLRA